jgi:hypothetical protein
MGRLFERLDEDMIDWIGRQHMFFVATAPTSPKGHLNVSPKGTMDTFSVIGTTRVAYLDLMGSGIETVAHLRENGRIVLMFCAFEGAPQVVRLHGQGRAIQPDDAEFQELVAAFTITSDLQATLRSIIAVDVTRISDSWGFVVRRMDFVEERRQLFRWADAQQRQGGDEWRLKYQQANNLASIDGLTGIDLPDELSDSEAKRSSSKGRAL